VAECSTKVIAERPFGLFVSYGNIELTNSCSICSSGNVDVWLDIVDKNRFVEI
jgi:hypothetical protein